MDHVGNVAIGPFLREAPRFGQSIFEYDSKSSGSHDYGGLVKEVIACEERYSLPLAG